MNMIDPDLMSIAGVLETDAPNGRYEIYRQLRQDHPVRWDPRWSIWVVTGYPEVAAALNDPRITAHRSGMDISWLPPERQGALEPVLRALRTQMLFLDGPDHSRLRSLANKAFTPRVVETMRERIQAMVDDLLDTAAARGRMDVVADLADPVPVRVIGNLLGVPPKDNSMLKRWSDHFAAFLDGSSLTPDTAAQALQSIGEFMVYFRHLTLSRRGAAHDDLLQALANAEVAGDRLSEDELLANCVLLLAAGHETTTNLIANGLFSLLKHPEQCAMLRAEPSLIQNAVNELLRYESPVQNTERRALVDLDLGGAQIAADQYLLIVLGAANRDPRTFTNPDTLDIRRQGPAHMAFGYGHHFCLGAALARVEGRIAIGSVIRRFPNLHLESADPRWKRSMLFRSLETLPVILA
ncbi:MAG TPA: cytochrome P450 [Chloroflexota bacterium]|nr:cytochrome P450 [Chloroflexota bacterium]